MYQVRWAVEWVESYGARDTYHTSVVQMANDRKRLYGQCWMMQEVCSAIIVDRNTGFRHCKRQCVEVVADNDAIDTSEHPPLDATPKPTHHTTNCTTNRTTSTKPTQANPNPSSRAN
jgi:hypothetical protein